MTTTPTRVGAALLLLLCRRHTHTMSRIYRPVNVVAKGTVAPRAQEKEKGKGSDKGKTAAADSQHLSKSLRLMVDNGVIRPSSVHGSYHFLPLGLRALEKLVRIVDKFMEKADCQKIQMPILTSTSLWKSTGRLEECKPELMIVSDRHSKTYLLSPTHEEAICDLVKSHPVSYRQLPLRLYQITEKFRDEKRPRFGLMRSRQFLMKDLYTFDASEESSKQTYEQIVNVYEELFSHLGLSYVKATGSSGTIGGDLSHEFHLLSEVGEDRLIHCRNCKEVFNQELHFQEQVETEVEVEAVDKIELTMSLGGGGGGGGGNQTKSKPRSTADTDNHKCIKCGSSDILVTKSTEVAHAFLLGTKYTKPLQTKYSTHDGTQIPMEMGCFGVGVTRLLAAIVETMSTEKEIRWPAQIAPFLLTVIPPKAGSKEEQPGNRLLGDILPTLREMLGGEIILDDRLDETVGKRLMDAKKLGFPYVAVLGKSVTTDPKPLIEVHDVNSGRVHMLGSKEIFSFMYDAKQNSILT